MKYRVFGRTGWKVSEIAFGAWQIGGDWGVVDDRHSIDTLLYAYEKGVNFVDTAELYGKGHSEEVIGRSLKEWKGDKIYVATKAQPVDWVLFARFILSRLHPRFSGDDHQDRQTNSLARAYFAAQAKRETPSETAQP